MIFVVIYYFYNGKNVHFFDTFKSQKLEKHQLHAKKILFNAKFCIIFGDIMVFVNHNYQLCVCLVLRCKLHKRKEVRVCDKKNYCELCDKKKWKKLNDF